MQHCNCRFFCENSHFSSHIMLDVCYRHCITSTGLIRVYLSLVNGLSFVIRYGIVMQAVVDCNFVVLFDNVACTFCYNRFC